MISRFISSNTCPAHFSMHCLAQRASFSTLGAPLPKIIRVTPCLMTTGSAFHWDWPEVRKNPREPKNKAQREQVSQTDRARHVLGVSLLSPLGKVPNQCSPKSGSQKLRGQRPAGARCLLPARPPQTRQLSAFSLQLLCCFHHRRYAPDLSSPAALPCTLKAVTELIIQ